MAEDMKRDPVERSAPCEECGGRGFYFDAPDRVLDGRMYEVKCEECAGTGTAPAAGVRAVFVRPGGRLEYRTVEPGRRSIRLPGPLPAFRLNDPPSASAFNVPAEDYELIGRVKGSAPRPVLAVYALEGSGYLLFRHTHMIAGGMLSDPAAGDLRLWEFGRAFDAGRLDCDPRTAIGISVRVLYEADWDTFGLEVWTVARSIEHVIIHGLPGGSKPAGLISGRSVSRGGGR